MFSGASEVVVVGDVSLYGDDWCYAPQDHDFFQHLEMHMRSEVHSLVGRDHMAFRSSFMPIKVRLLCPIIRHFFCFQFIEFYI